MAATMRPREREAPAPGKPVPDLPAGQTAKPRLAGRPDPARPGRRLGPAGRVVVTGAVCFGLWALLAAPTLRRAAETSPLGVRRTVSLAVLRPLARVSEWVGLDRVGTAAEVALGRRPAANAPPVSAGEPPPEGLASPGPSPIPPASPHPHGSPSAPGNPVPGGMTVGGGAITIHVPKPTSERRVRALVVGDSIGDDMAMGLARLLDDKGGFVVKIDARQATGLARPDYFDWRAQVAADVRSFKPNVVLAMFGGNDDQNFIAGGQGYVLGSTGWRDVYGERVGRIMNDVTSAGRPIVWVGMPPMKSAGFSATMKMLNGIFRSQAARHPGAVYVDGWSALADAHGHYAAYLPNGSGQQELLRQPDGVHLTAAGGARLAERVFQVLRILWGQDTPPSPSLSPSPLLSPAPVSGPSASPGALIGRSAG